MKARALLVFLATVSILACGLIPPKRVPVSEVAPMQRVSIKYARGANATVPILASYTTIGTVNIRDNAGAATGDYLTRGQPVSCDLHTDGWCILRNNTRVWGGCLEPNPQERKCEKR